MELVKNVIERTFGQIVDDLIAGCKMKRLEWPDDGTYIVISDEKLKLYKLEDKLLHNLVVSLGDLCGEDWVEFIHVNEKSEDKKLN